MANLAGFDASAVEPNTFEAIPQGTYNAIITESEWKQTSSGNGRYLQMKFQVIDGQYKGRVLFARLNLENPNAKAVEIARSQLSTICRAVGVMKPNDSCELHNLPLGISVVCRKNESTGDVVNDIKSFRTRLAVSAVPQDNASDVAPWARNK